MSLHIHRELTCDQGGAGSFECGNSYDGAPWHRTVSEVRRAAAYERGWSFRNGMDLCAQHASPDSTPKG